MGYTIDIAQAKTDFESLKKSLPADVIGRFDEFIQTLESAHVTLQSLHLNNAGEGECIKLLKRTAGPKQFNLDEKAVKPITGSKDFIAPLTILREKDGEKRTVVLNFRVTLGGSSASEFICSGCGVRILTKADVTKAHNVIPSSSWKKILAAAVSALIRSLEEGKNHEQSKNHIKSCEVLCEALYTGARDSKTPWAMLAAKLPARSEIKEEDWNCLLLLLSCGESANSPGATSYEGGQCTSCEALHNNMSLIQRVAFVADVHGPAHRNAVMVGNALSGKYKDALEHMEPADVVDHTRRVAGLVLEEMCRRIKTSKECVLRYLILKNWDLFASEITELAVVFCSLPRNREADEIRFWGPLGGLAKRL
jgi:hypothetical protein